MGITEPIVIVIIIFVVITLMALRRRILFRMGLRNLTRRKSQTAVVILGLLIGTAIISSSLVIGDTLEYIFVDDVIDKLDAIDELVYDRPPRTGEYPFFNISTFTVLKDSLESNNTPIDGIAPLIIKQVGVSYIEEDTVEGGVTLMGFNASQEEGFGSFKGLEDEVVDEGLALNNTIINERLSEKLNADTGGTIAVRFGDNTTYLTVEYIVENEGKGNWEKTSCIFVSLETAQTIFDNQSGKINAIKISNRGGVVEGVDLSAEVSEDARAVIAEEGWSLEVDERKKEGIEDAKEFSDYVTEIFMVLGMFSIIAGVILIINIFVMLAEERKSEMGISRAVGMKRGHLMQTYLFEGLFYAILAALLGTFFGLIIGYVIIFSFGIIFASVAEGISLTFHFELMSIVLSFCLGLIITFVTIAVASWNVSKLNIVRAIRKIPEPVSEKATKKTILSGTLLIIIGAVLSFKAVEVGTTLNVWIFAGPGLIILGSAFVLYRVVSARTAFTLAGIAIITWVLFPRGSAKGEPADIQMFIVIGLLLVLGGILVVMFNSDYILKPFLFTGRKGKGKPVLRIATSYPMRKKFRTGMTLAIFALVIFTVTVISMMSHLQSASITEEMQRQTGGFDIVGMTMNQTINLTEEIEDAESIDVDEFEFYADVSIVDVSVKTPRRSDPFEYMLWGFDDDMLAVNEYTFRQKADNYSHNGEIRPIETDRDVWNAIKANSSLAVVDGSASMIHYD
ncbi:MAG: ABC transporter permease, partial [Thermoplasmata archaeon]|nr:ABC transporter permease [Thermoplasmata archaeon]